jgi:GH18 family chitinase
MFEFTKVKMWAIALSFMSIFYNSATAKHQTLHNTDNNTITAGYYTNWDIYARDFKPHHVQWNKLNHVLYAFAQAGKCWASNLAETADDDWANYKATGKVPCPRHDSLPELSGVLDHRLGTTDPWSDYNQNTINLLRQAAQPHGVKPLISVGGWSMSIALLDTIVYHADIFIPSVVQYVSSHQFHGVDIDLEPYSNDWTRMSEYELDKFVDFMINLRRALPAHQLLTAAIATHPAAVAHIGATRIAQLNNVLDFLYIMSYDMRGAWAGESHTNYHAPLFYDPAQPDHIPNREILNTAVSLHAWENFGMSKAKLLVGFPSYGRGFKRCNIKDQHPQLMSQMRHSSHRNATNVNKKVAPAVSHNKNGRAVSEGIYEPFCGLAQGTYDAGVKSYDKLNSEGSFVYAADPVGASVVVGNDVYTLDNVASLEVKSCYVQHRQYAGMFTWALSDNRQGQLLQAAKTKNNCEQHKDRFVAQDVISKGIWDRFVASYRRSHGKKA